MSQITLPWIPKDPDVLAGYRAKAIRGLLGIGLVLVLIGIILFFAFGLQAESKITDWRIIFAYFGVLAPVATGATLFVGGLGVVFWRGIGAILKLPWVGFLLFFGGVAVVGLLVWATAWLFSFMGGLGPGYVTAQAIYDEICGSFAVPMAAYLLWPLQCDVLRDLITMAAVVGFVSIVAAFGIWWERKVAGRMQSRLGPMRVGMWHGWLQSPADGTKLVLKEDIVPAGGDGILFRLAPYVCFVPAMCAFVALPFAAAWVSRDLDVALLFILAMLGIEVIGVIIAGWASNNKWSVLGSMREACQMISYEIPMGMSLLIPVMMVGTLQLSKIGEAQSGGFQTWLVFANPWCFAACFTYFIGALASCKRTPFDLPESESELVAGFLTEYSGFRWALFFFGEYSAMFAVSGLAVLLFLGAWHSPLPVSWVEALGDAWYVPLIRGLFFAGPLIFILKAMFIFFVQLWLRWTLPRLRIDQVLYACVQVLLPLVMVLLLGNTLWILFVKYYEVGWFSAIDAILHWLLVAIGVVAVATALGIAGYGLMNRRRLVGYLAIDHLPGS
ncbi:MAG: NADH-quinone oxidoreductase subunit NuoH [Phycisphaerae bacterium]|nr:NADH-quinone oxidoreductase subunit NuoH [Phycisphaerae bacterium]